jgi:hypothetical protein
MKVVVLVIAVFFATSIGAQGVPGPFRTQLLPVIEADGTHKWTAVIELDTEGVKTVVGNDEAIEKLVRAEIAKAMGLYRFCESGWEITGRTQSAASLRVEGRCRAMS